MGPTGSVLQRSVALLGDGDRNQAEPHRHCGSRGLLQAHRASCSAEAGPRCVSKSCNIKKFFPPTNVF